MKARNISRAWPAALLLLALAALSVWKLPYGCATSDETLYLSIAYRFLQGDVPLLHEWHVTQLSSLLLLPLLRVWLALAGGGEGVVLGFRWLHLVFHALTAAYLHARLRRVSSPGALAAAAMYFLFTPFNIMALSYNTMGIGLMAIALVTLATTEGARHDAWLIGLCFGGAVLCNPYYFLLYPLYLLAALVWGRRGAARLSGRFALRLTAGGALMAMYALALILRHTELAALRVTLPAILYGDTAEHPARSLPGVLYGIWASFGKNRLFVPTLGLSAALCLCRVLDRGWRARRGLYLAAAALLSIAYGLWFRLFLPISLNFYMFPLSILGFFAWTFSDERRSPLFFFVYLPGVVCWLCSAMASNLGFFNIASVSTLNMLASAVLLFKAMEPLRGGGRGRLCAAAMGLALLVQFALLGVCRFTTVYPMESAAACSARVEHGALRGLRVKPGEAARQEQAWELCAPVRAAGEGRVAYFTEIPGQYLEDAKGCGVFSAWFPGVSVRENLPRLALYWSLFPERRPDWIVLGLDDPAANELLAQALEEQGFTRLLRLPGAPAED